jgi:hypothetical protein
LDFVIEPSEHLIITVDEYRELVESHVEADGELDERFDGL